MQEWVIYKAATSDKNLREKLWNIFIKEFEVKILPKKCAYTMQLHLMMPLINISGDYIYKIFSSR